MSPSFDQLQIIRRGLSPLGLIYKFNFFKLSQTRNKRFFLTNLYNQCSYMLYVLTKIKAYYTYYLLSTAINAFFNHVFLIASKNNWQQMNFIFDMLNDAFACLVQNGDASFILHKSIQPVSDSSSLRKDNAYGKKFENSVPCDKWSGTQAKVNQDLFMENNYIILILNEKIPPLFLNTKCIIIYYTVDEGYHRFQGVFVFKVHFQRKCTILYIYPISQVF